MHIFAEENPVKVIFLKRDTNLRTLEDTLLIWK